MDGLFIFDESNDLIYSKLNNKISEKLLELAKNQGLLDENNVEHSNTSLDNNIIMQIFSPLITSQRIMLCQFDNSYSSIQCEDNFTIVLEEILGCLFLKAGTDSLEFMEKSLKTFMSFVKRICGPNIYLLKTDIDRKAQVNTLYNTWTELYFEKQTIFIEAIEQLLVNSEVKRKALQGLRSIDNFKDDFQKSHGLLFVDDKLLSLYSSRQSQPLSAADLIFITIFIKTILKNKVKPKQIYSELFFFDGVTGCTQSGCIPNIVHVSFISDDIYLVVLTEHSNLNVSNNLFDIFFAVQKVKNLQSQGDLENLRQAYDTMDFQIKQIQDALKRVKNINIDVEEAIKIFGVKWDLLKKIYLEYFKTKDRNIILKIESNLPKINDSLKMLFNLLIIKTCHVKQSQVKVVDVSTSVEENLSSFKEFLTVKSHTNFSITSYLEEFPGLVHFIHVDRSNNRLTAPNIEATSENSQINFKKKVWSMVEFSRQYLNKGHLNMMWKDVAFHYTYFMWFEDMNGMAIKPKDIPNFSVVSLKPQLSVGILSGDYYQRFIEAAFPKTNPNKIKCYELYCIHLGLVTSTVVLEHCRRLAATINDVVGISRNSTDLL
uniref:CSON015331 protein n=1 Tax=Culicoides sonorensis TaxID=179676 RepID=A0A336LSK3_CULSO